MVWVASVALHTLELHSACVWKRRLRRGITEKCSLRHLASSQASHAPDLVLIADLLVQCRRAGDGRDFCHRLRLVPVVVSGSLGLLSHDHHQLCRRIGLGGHAWKNTLGGGGERIAPGFAMSRETCPPFSRSITACRLTPPCSSCASPLRGSMRGAVCSRSERAQSSACGEAAVQKLLKILCDAAVHLDDTLVGGDPSFSDVGRAPVAWDEVWRNNHWSTLSVTAVAR